MGFATFNDAYSSQWFNRNPPLYCYFQCYLKCQSQRTVGKAFAQCGTLARGFLLQLLNLSVLTCFSACRLVLEEFIISWLVMVSSGIINFFCAELVSGLSLVVGFRAGLAADGGGGLVEFGCFFDE